ncbi:hypothetical protein HID58_035727 [Brassica napus]|uniref:Uncharacterized protein n=1 Tax=Brassica napus TaxID=3708 RepID=A0ABQ8C5Q2_BRANA|nr:hypothetical protein HID58_035727 [Brassica napus]
MARSLCIVTFLMIFLLISTGIPKGKAQCMGEQRSTVPTGMCTTMMCNNACRIQGYYHGKCETQDKTEVCHCYSC